MPAAAAEHEQIGLAVAVEVRRAEHPRVRDAVVGLRRLEGAVSLAEEDLHGGGVVRDREVRLAVAVEVARDDRVRRAAHREGPRRLERSVAVAQEHARTAPDGDGEIGLAVAVEVGARDRERRGPRVVGAGGRVGAAAPVHDDVDGVAPVGRGREVGPAVAVEVRRDDVHRARAHVERLGGDEGERAVRRAREGHDARAGAAGGREDQERRDERTPAPRTGVGHAVDLRPRARTSNGGALPGRCPWSHRKHRPQDGPRPGLVRSRS